MTRVVFTHSKYARPCGLFRNLDFPCTVSLRTSLPLPRSQSPMHAMQANNISHALHASTTRAYSRRRLTQPQTTIARTPKIKGLCSSVQETQHRHHEHLSCQYGALRRQCLHRPLLRLWEQTLDPRHSSHSLLRRLCSHICDPPHSLHLLFSCLWCICSTPGTSCTRSCGSHTSMPAYLQSPAFLAPAFPCTDSRCDYARISAIPHTPCTCS
jgi:hypothetical protein